MRLNVALLALGLAAFGTALAAEHPAGGRVVAAADFADAAPPRPLRDASGSAASREPLRAATSQVAANDLQWPLRAAHWLDVFDYHGTKFFVDHDARYPGFVRDYTCGTRSYDLSSGYNHGGTDYFLWPYPWLMMDQGAVEVVAAAPGVISVEQDGNFDRQCAFDGVSHANLVQVRQDDGLTAIYMHLRNGSVTHVPLGTRVAAGDYLGLVGSSGQSTGPHLHFELQDASGAVVDPRHGDCNAGPERWAQPQAYEDPRIDTLTTHSAPPVQIVCGSVGGTDFRDDPHYQDLFAAGDTVWFFASYSDQRNGEVTTFRVLRPDASVFAQWDFDLASEHLAQAFYAGTSWDWPQTLPADAPSGTWQVEASFQGRTYSHAFTVSDLALDAAAAARKNVARDAQRCHAAAATVCTP